MILCLNPKPVIPGETVPNNETTEYVVRSKNADHAEGEEGQSDTERKE
jgi:hypothetical protein